jgi:hypothetical protein
MPVLTAHVTGAELTRWFPIRFEDIDDPLAAAEPSKAALVQLRTGDYVVLSYGKESEQLTVEIPSAAADTASVLAALFDEVPLSPSRVLWHREGIKLPQRLPVA